MKTVVITGAGSGIGKACAELFYKKEFNIVLIGRTKSKLEEVSSEFHSDKYLNISADVSNEEDVKKLADTITKKFETIDTLINNAGIAAMKKISQLSLETWQDIQSINSTGVFLMSKFMMPYLSQSSGSIINVSSVSGLGGDWGGFAYNASKGAVTNFTKALALDYQSNKVRVNAVAPSLTDTPMAADIKDDEKLYAKFQERIPMGRAAEPIEVAEAIYFLNSDQANFINGVVLPVDGGLSASNGQPPLNL